MAASTFHLLKVAEIREDTPDALIIEFEVPRQLEEEYQFLPGQYLTLRRQINGEEIRRSYSISSTPDDKELQVAVKILLDGKFSGYAKNELRVGDELEVMTPLGKFTPRNKETAEEEKHYLAFAAGSGITPIMSIMKTVLNKDSHAYFTLVYGNRTRKSVMFREEIEGLKSRYMNRLLVYNLFTRENMDSDLFSGRINKEKVEDLERTVLDLDRTDEIFICGPEPMILNLRDYFMADLEMDPHKIHIELFTSPEQPKPKPEDWDEREKDVDGSEVSKVTVHIDDASYDMDLEYNGETILDKGLNEGLDLPYSCKGGVCTTCRAKLLEGEVEMEVCYGLEPEEIEDKYILTCQSHPRSKKVVVDYDV